MVAGNPIAINPTERGDDKTRPASRRAARMGASIRGHGARGTTALCMGGFPHHIIGPHHGKPRVKNALNRKRILSSRPLCQLTAPFRPLDANGLCAHGDRMLLQTKLPVLGRIRIICR
jgi:hypothetical protein